MLATSGGTEIKEICKIGVFGTGCPSSVTVSEDPSNPWTETTTTFNLLTQSTETITFPSVVTSPTGCYPIIWRAKRTIDDNFIAQASPTILSMGSTELTISHVISDFSQRLERATLATDYYFEGAV